MCAEHSENATPPTGEPLDVDECVRRQIEANVAWYAARLDEIERRLDELDGECDADRTVQTYLGGASLVTGLMGVFSRRWSLIGAGIGGTLLSYALRDRRHPPEILRRLGLRTREEIDTERMALKALRGDFKEVGSNGTDPCEAAHKALRAAGLPEDE